MTETINSNYKIEEPFVDLIIESSDSEEPIIIIDNRMEGISRIEIKENTKVIYKSKYNTNKTFNLEKNSQLKCFDTGKMVKTSVILTGENSEFTHKGLLIGSGDWKIESYHKAKQTKTNIIIRNVLDKDEFSRIDGLINIAKSCSGSIGDQKIDTLILDDSAKVNSTPMLEIETDDVNCSHSASITKLDELSLFYLQSRGLPKKVSEDLLIEGFKNFDETITELLTEK